MTVNEWLDACKRDAERREVPQLSPLIDGLRASIERLRAADWNDDLRGVRPPDQAARSRP